MTLSSNDLTIIKVFTRANDHQLAMWYAARQLGLKIEIDLAILCCRMQVEGMMTHNLVMESEALRRRLHESMDLNTLKAFRSVT